MSTENHTNFLGVPSQRRKYHKLKIIILLINSSTENEIQMCSIKIIVLYTSGVENVHVQVPIIFFYTKR